MGGFVKRAQRNNKTDSADQTAATQKTAPRENAGRLRASFDWNYTK